MSLLIPPLQGPANFGFLRALKFLLGLAFLFGVQTRADLAESVPCPFCQGTSVCTAPGCKEGKSLCPGKCLKKETPGWKKKKIEGFSDDELWMEFRYKTATGSGVQSFSQHHIGEVVEYEDGMPVNRGRCPQCEGTTRVICAPCAGSGKCASCAGAGKFVRGESLFTLIDQQGRSLEAVIKARQGDKLTVLRLADRKVFDLPASSLSDESLGLIEKRFPATP